MKWFGYWCGAILIPKKKKHDKNVASSALCQTKRFAHLYNRWHWVNALAEQEKDV